MSLDKHVTQKLSSKRISKLKEAAIKLALFEMAHANVMSTSSHDLWKRAISKVRSTEADIKMT